MSTDTQPTVINTTNPMLPDDAERRLWAWGLPRCEHLDRLPVRVEQTMNRTSTRLQCQCCGKLGDVLRTKDHPDAPLWNASALDHWSNLRVEAGRRAMADAQQRHAMRQAKRDVDEQLWWQAYNEFIKTEAWQVQRKRVLIRDGYRCQANGPRCTGRATEVHHRGQDLAYRYMHYIGWAPDYTLAALCHECHQGRQSITDGDRAMRREK